MADGSAPQREFHFPRKALVSALREGEIVVDLFAGGGGASEAIEQATQRPVDIAVNHDAWAIAMHAANHPFTLHLQDDVWHAHPVRLVAGRRIGWFHASPDCTHFSQARGGQPRSRATRALSWVILKWIGMLDKLGLAPRIFSLENVEQILQWCPLIAKRCPKTGRVVTLETIADPETGKKTLRVADKGEQVAVWNQCLVPDKRRLGQTWRQFVAALRAFGYTVEWRKLVACDYGAGTSRKRLFLIGRRDGEAIRWPEPSHGPGRAQPYVTAAHCIDWGIPGRSIFGRKKPLADATLRRIARGIKRYVIDAAEPFIVQCANASANGIAPSSAPLGTVTAWPKRGSHAVVAPTLVQSAYGEGSGSTARRGTGAHDAQQPVGTIHAGGGSFAMAAATLVQTGYGERPGQAPRVPGIDKPLGTLVDGQKHAAVVAFLEQANGGFYTGCGKPITDPVSTITGASGVTPQRLITANIVTMRNNATGGPVTDPLGTITAGTVHHGLVECTLSPEQEAGALQVAAFLMRYYSQGGQWGEVTEPFDTITTRDRLALVTVTIHGTPYVIVDIALRMLTPAELFKAQGFPADYIIDRTADGRRLTNDKAVRMVGNSVSPPPLRAIAVANLDHAPIAQKAAA